MKKQPQTSTRTLPASAIEPLEARIAPAKIFALDTANHLLTFDSASAATVASVTITGFGAGERIADLDVRPATGELYALSIQDTVGLDTGRIYKINPTTGVATQVGGTAFSTGLADGASYGFDFNPVVDRLRVINSAGENLRVNPDTGALAGTDTNFTFIAPATGPVIDVAYDQNGSDATTTTLFGIDSGSDRLVRIGGVNGVPSPNTGVVTAVGALGVNATAVGAFDIQNQTGTAYAALQVGATTSLYTVNLTSGAATLVSTLGTGAAITGLAVAMPGATIVNAHTATFTDVDGDKAVVRVSKGSLSAEDFRFSTLQSGRSQLLEVNLSDDGAEFDRANVTISVQQRIRGSDGQVNVGFINATGHDLGTVIVRGDLGQIDAGDATTATFGVKTLRVNSMGRFGLDTQDPATASLSSDITGPVRALTVFGDIEGAAFNVTGGTDGRIFAVSVRGSIIGTGDFNGGTIFADGDITRAFVGQNIEGGAGSSSGSIFSFGTIRHVSVGGSVIGGAGLVSGFIQSTGDTVFAKIKGDLRGGAGSGSGSLIAAGNLGSLSIGGSLIGGRGDDSGEIFASGNISRIAIKHDFVGGSITGSDGDLSASGYIESLGRIGSIFIGGSFITGTDTSAAGDLNSNGSIRVGDNLGLLQVQGSIVGNADSIATIVARGREVPTSTTDQAIGRIIVRGRVEYASVLAGYDRDLVGKNADAQIGSVRVGGDWIATSLVAGAGPGVDTRFGTADDILLSGPGVKDTARTFAKIGSVSIRGTALGTPDSVSALDRFGIVAERIGPVRVHGVGIPHPSGLHNSDAAIGSTGDFRLNEV